MCSLESEGMDFDVEANAWTCMPQNRFKLVNRCYYICGAKLSIVWPFSSQ